MVCLGFQLDRHYEAFFDLLLDLGLLALYHLLVLGFYSDYFVYCLLLLSYILRI